MNLIKFAEKYDIKRSNDGVYRIERGGFSFQFIIGKQSFLKAVFMAVTFSQSVSKEVFKSIQKENKLGQKPNIFDAYISNNAFVYNSNFKSKDELLSFIDKQVDLYKKANLKPLVEDVTGSEITDGVKFFDFLAFNGQMVLNNVAVPINKDKFKEIIKQEENEILAEKENTKNYPKALLMATLGAVIGALPSIILYTVGYMVAVVFALIPFVAFYFYNKAKGPKNIFSIVYIGIIGLICAVLSSLFGMYTLALYYNVPFDVLFSDPELSASLMTDFALTILFYGIALVFAIQYMYRQTTSKKLNDIKKLSDK